MVTQNQATSDEITTSEFKAICVRFGVSPSRAISILKNNFENADSYQSQPDISTINPVSPLSQKLDRKQVAGFMRGHFEMTDDFDAPMVSNERDLATKQTAI
ncbi:MAG: hypothetical protein FWG02_11300 [Holophagaceae bacterium]|nr:hypothetical protein [Holophagaceae bacterium]